MKSFRISCFILFVLATLPSVNAGDFEAALSSETAEFTFRSDSSVIGWGGSDLALSVFYNDDSDLIGQGSIIQMRQASEETPLTFGVGVKGYLGYLDDPDEEVLAFAIGGEIRYTIPGTMPMALYGRAFWAPDITSFSDVEGVIDYSLGFQIEALPQTVAFVGIRHLEFDLDDDGDYEADDDNLHIGVRLTF
jgi:hypothetical protein